MTKKTLQFVAAAAMVAGLGFGSVSTAFAASDSTSASGTNSGGLHTTANVSLTAGSTAGGDNGDGGHAGDGSLALVKAPSYEIVGGILAGETLDLPGKATDSEPVQTVNPGIKTDWTVSVANTKFSTDFTGNGTSTFTPSGTDLSGAVLTLTDGTVTTADGTANDVAAAQAPTAAKSIALDGTGTAQQVVAATGNAGVTGDQKAIGVGTWNTNYNTASLKVPDGNTAGDYTSHLTWTLTNSAN